MPGEGENERNLWALQKRRTNCFCVLVGVSSISQTGKMQSSRPTLQALTSQLPQHGCGTAPPDLCGDELRDTGVEKLRFIICLVLAKSGLIFAHNSHTCWYKCRCCKWKWPRALYSLSLHRPLWAEINRMHAAGWLWVSQIIHPTGTKIL